MDAVCPAAGAGFERSGGRRGVRRRSALGAQGVSLGTVFVTTEEAFVRDEFKQRMVESTANDGDWSEFLFDVGLTRRTSPAC